MSQIYELYPFQAEDVKLMTDQPYFLNGNSVGTGKTIEHLWEVKNYIDQNGVSADFAVLILTLKAAIPQWELWIERLFGQDDLSYRFLVTNHEQLLKRYREICVYCAGVKSEGDPCPECKDKGWRLKTKPNEDLRRKWTFVIVDECHRVKNRKAAQTKALKALTHKMATYKRMATGTPIINQPADLWALLHYMDPKKWSSYWRFFEQFVDYWEDYKTIGKNYDGTPKLQGFKVILGAKNEAMLRKELEGIFIARKKKGCRCIYAPCPACGGLRVGECTMTGLPHEKLVAHDHLADLPDMPEPVVRYVELDGPQKRAYKAMQKEALAWVGANEDQPLPAPVVIAQYRRLQMLADAYLTEYGPQDFKMSLPSAKLETLWDIVEGTDEPIVVFSQFRQMIVLAYNYLLDKPWPDGEVLMMHGQSSAEWKKESWQYFQRGNGRIFLTTIGAGGIGIDLFRASVCVFLDRSWSPAQNEQAEGRLFRAGQKNSVQRFYIEAKDTIDQKVGAKLEWKYDLIRRILGG